MSRNPWPRRLASLRGQLVLVLACVLVVAPVYFLVLGSFKSIGEFFSSPFSLPQSLALRNFEEAWREASLGTAFRNSVLITASAVFLSTAASAMAAFAIAKLRLRAKGFLQLFLLAGLVLPTQLMVIAAFLEMRWLGLVGTVLPMILLYAVLGMPIGVLFLVGFFRALPTALTEAAAVDGASIWRQFVDIALPLVRAPILTVALLNSVWIWNDFFIPLVFASDERLQTVPLAVLNFYGESSTDLGLIFAGVVMAALPVVIVYVAMTRQFIGGVMAGSIKG